MNFHRFALRMVDLRRLVSAFSSRASSTVLSFLVLLIASRLLPTAEYGLYIFQFSIGSALGLFFVLGQQILVVKHYRLGAADDPTANAALIRTNLRWLALGCGLLVVAGALCVAFSSRLPRPYDHLYIACWFAAVFALAEYLQNYFRIHGEIGLSLTPREIVWRVTSIIGLALLWAIGRTDGVIAIGVVTALLAAITLWQCVPFVRRERSALFGAPLFGIRPETHGDAETRRQWRTETYYFVANGFLNASAGYLETILIGVVVGLEEAAFYFVAQRISQLLALPVAAIDTVGIPLVAARFQDRDIPGAQKLVATLSAGGFAISLAGALVLAVVGPFVLELFDPVFARNEGTFAVLCMVAAATAFFGPGSWLLMIGGGERYFLAARSVVFVAYLGLLAALGYHWGLVGIAVASLVSTIVTNLVATVWIMHKWGIDNMATAVLRPFLLFGRRFAVNAPVEPPVSAASTGEAGRPVSRAA